MFESIVSVMESNKVDCPTLIYYFKRHIELDGDEHGPMAEKCLTRLLDSNLKIEQASTVALESLRKRSELWDFVQKQILAKCRAQPVHL